MIQVLGLRNFHYNEIMKL